MEISKTLQAVSKLRQQARTLGAKWNPEEKYWEMDFEIAKKLGLKKRIINKTIKRGV